MAQLSQQHPLFQFTPLREGRRRNYILPNIKTTFQFTPLREGRPDAHGTQITPTANFNSRPSARGDQQHRELVALWDKFQFTPLREGRPARRW